MLTAIAAGRSDHVPLSFMILQALQARSAGWRDCIERSIELGMDPVESGGTLLLSLLCVLFA